MGTIRRSKILDRIRQALISIRTKLWLAFGSVAAMTLIASIVALHGFAVANQSINTFSVQSVPVIKALSRVAQQGHILLGAIPNMMFAQTDETLGAAFLRVDNAEEAFLNAQYDVTKALNGHAYGSQLNHIKDLSSRIAAHLQILQSALIYRHDKIASGRKLVLKIQNMEDKSNRIQNQLPSQLARIILFLPMTDLKGIEQEIQNTNHNLPIKIEAALVQIQKIRQAELIAADLSTRQLERIRSLGSFLDVEIDRQLNYWQVSVDAEHSHVKQSLENSRLLLMIACGAAIFGAFGIGWFYLGKNIVTRISRINTSMRSIADGNFDTPIPTSGSDEIAHMGASLTVFKDAMERVAHIAHHDSLTGYLNRQGFMARSEKLIHNHPFGCLIYLNLRAFKEINDTFGHEVGDRVLIATAKCIYNISPSECVLGRLGGDDFAVCLPNHDIDSALKHTKTIQAALRNISIDDTATSDLNAAFGIVVFPQDGDTPAKLLQRADMAMNDARGEDTEAIRIYEKSLGEDAIYRKTLRSELFHALTENQFFLQYQPQIDINTRRVTGAEALIRWRHPIRGLISPGDFIPIAERSGFIQELGTWVLNEACKQLKTWRASGLDIQVAVNVSPLQILDPKIVDHVNNALQTTGIPANKLELEITESIFLRDETTVLERLQELRDCNLDIALDDFGTGYSSLSYLKRLPVSTLKIDQSFVREMFTGNDDTRITSAIINMAHSLNLKVIAEGIENERQLEFFRNAACDVGQGFLFSRPLNVEDFERFVESYSLIKEGSEA